MKWRDENANPEAHYDTTGPRDLAPDKRRCRQPGRWRRYRGTITGAGRYLKEQNAAIELVGADPEGSIYTKGPEGDLHQYDVEGVGEDFYPETMNLDLRLGPSSEPTVVDTRRDNPSSTYSTR